MFIVDATGSMGDELEFLKTELLDVIQRVQNDNNNSTIRLGSVFYRDEGDDYTVKNFSLTENINEICRDRPWPVSTINPHNIS